MTHYPEGADGWAGRCDDAGLNVDALTSEFIAEVRVKVPPKLLAALGKAPLLSEREIDRWENRHHPEGVRHGRKAA